MNATYNVSMLEGLMNLGYLFEVMNLRGVNRLYRDYCDKHFLNKFQVERKVKLRGSQHIQVRYEINNLCVKKEAYMLFKSDIVETYFTRGLVFAIMSRADRIYSLVSGNYLQRLVFCQLEAPGMLLLEMTPSFAMYLMNLTERYAPLPHTFAM